MDILLEAMGDRPAWMKIKNYKAEGRKAELILGLGKKKKSYWFPVTPNVYSQFKEKILDSRLVGLRYLQAYIRRYRGYLERWPSKRYVKANQLSKSLLQESIVAQVDRLLSEGANINEISKKTLLPVRLLEKLLKTAGRIDDLEFFSTF